MLLGWAASIDKEVVAHGNNKVTICHASGLAGTTKFETLTIGYNAVYGPAGHFYENGTPKAGHEQDYIGACKTPTPTKIPTATFTPMPTSTVIPTSTCTPKPTDTPMLTSTPISDDHKRHKTSMPTPTIARIATATAILTPVAPQIVLSVVPVVPPTTGDGGFLK